MKRRFFSALRTRRSLHHYILKTSNVVLLFTTDNVVEGMTSFSTKTTVDGCDVTENVGLP